MGSIPGQDRSKGCFCLFVCLFVCLLLLLLLLCVCVYIYSFCNTCLDSTVSFSPSSAQRALRSFTHVKDFHVNFLTREVLTGCDVGSQGQGVTAGG